MKVFRTVVVKNVTCGKTENLNACIKLLQAKFPVKYWQREVFFKDKFNALCYFKEK